MAAKADSFFAMVRHQHPVSRPLLSHSSPEERDRDSTRQGWQLPSATAAIHEEAAKSKFCTVQDDQLHHILETTKHKHYRRRRSSVSIKLSKPASMEAFHQQQAEALTQQLVTCQEKQRQQTQAYPGMTEHACHLQKCCHEDEQEKQELEETLKNQDNCNGSPAADQQQAIVIHKPQPLPLRPSIVNPSPFSGLSYSIKVLFEREHEALLQWQKTDFQAFSEEVQESLGGTLKKHLREYHRALQLLRQPILSRPVKDGNQATTGVAACVSSSSPKDDRHDEAKDEREDYLRARQKYHCTPSNEGILQLIDAAGSSRLQIDGTDSIRLQMQERRSQTDKIDSDIAGTILEGFRFHGDHTLQQMQEHRMEKVMEAFVKSREAVVSVREVSQRIEEHKNWMQLELNLTRLELMNLRFYRCNSPRAVLREAMELSSTVRSFILELSSALDWNDLGIPWRLSRKADCSDVTPLFIKHLVKTLLASASAS